VEKVSQLEKEPLNYFAWSNGCQMTNEKKANALDAIL
jgi:hypothetical protein